MGRIVGRGASADRILRDVTETLAVAEATGPEMFEDAERYLTDALARVAEVDQKIDDTEALVVRGRAQLKAANERANDLIHRTRDDFFNLIGRASRDTSLVLVFAGGGSGRFTSFSPRQKPLSLEMLATALETNRHRRVSDADLERMTTALREEATTMTGILSTLEPGVAQLKVLRSQRTASVQLAQRQLSALKRFWIGEGLSEAEIHEVIPSRRRGRSKGTDEAVEETTDGETPEDEDGFELELVDPDLDDDVDDEESDEAEDEEAVDDELVVI